MQPVMAEIAFTFLDDAHALVTGLGRIIRDLSVDMLKAAGSRLMRPINNLAQACDVAGPIASRKAHAMRPATRGPRPKNIWAAERKRRRFRMFGICDAFRNLNHLS